MKLSDIASFLDAALRGHDVEFQNISIDTRRIKPGELYVAIVGEQFDGHDFVAQAKAQGAIAAIVSKPVTTDLPTLQVADTRMALGKLAAYHRRQFNIPVIALTGSCGKTTTKEMLRSILVAANSPLSQAEEDARRAGEDVLASVSSFNNDIGVPLTLLQLNKAHQYAVIEVGANHPGEIAYLTQIVKPTLAFILNVAPAHLAGFGSIEGIMQAKSEIFAGLAEDGIAMINADDKFADEWRELLKDQHSVTFGVHQAADYSATEIKANDDGCCSFVLNTPAEKIAIQLSLFGEHYVLNAVAAAAAAHSIGVPLTAIKQGLETMQAVKGRLVLKPGKAGARILDDTYNAIPYAVAASLRVLAKYSGERVFVFGGMREIGATAQEEHMRIGELAKQLGIQQLFAYGEYTDATVKAFGAGAHYFASQAELSDAVRDILRPDMTVLVKGSRGSKMENVVQVLVNQ